MVEIELLLVDVAEKGHLIVDAVEGEHLFVEDFEAHSS